MKYFAQKTQLFILPYNINTAPSVEEIMLDHSIYQPPSKAHGCLENATSGVFENNTTGQMDLPEREQIVTLATGLEYFIDETEPQ